MQRNRTKKFGEESDLAEKVVQIDRVTRVVAGGRRFRFRATVVVGDKKGKVGIGTAKGTEVTLAISKASSVARKGMIEIPLAENTIPYQIKQKYSSAYVFLKPASKGTGIIAGGSVRMVLELAGVKDVLSKILGSPNKINNAQATFLALLNMKKIKNITNIRKGIKETKKEKRSDKEEKKTEKPVKKDTKKKVTKGDK